MYQISAIDKNIHLVALSKSDDIVAPHDKPNNVYIIDSGPLTLINAGHPDQSRALVSAIRELGRAPSDIERILYTSWSIDALGGAGYFPRADHFVLSPDGVDPFNYEAIISTQRQRLIALAQQLDESEQLDGEFVAKTKDFVSHYYPAVTSGLRFIPCQNGQFIRAGHLELEVLDTPGPSQGHASYYEPDKKWLFSGQIALKGLPDIIHDVQKYLTTYEQLMRLDCEQLLPDHGKPTPRATWTLGRTYRFLNNFLSSAPSALVQEVTIREFIEKDLGYPPEPGVELLYDIFRYGALFEELVKNRSLNTTGSGLEKRYCTPLDDSRAPLRR